MEVPEYKTEYRLSQWREIIKRAEATRKECARIYPPQYSPEVFRKVMEQIENFEENN